MVVGITWVPWVPLVCPLRALGTYVPFARGPLGFFGSHLFITNRVTRITMPSPPPPPPLSDGDQGDQAQ